MKKSLRGIKMAERKILTLREFAKDPESVRTGDVVASTLQASAHIMNDGEVIENAASVDPDSLFDGGTLKHIASDETLDRHGDIVSAKGWLLENFRKNPVVLWAHSHTRPPIGKNTSIDVIRKKLVALSEYPSQKIHEFGNTAFRLSALGYLNAVSVGFMPKKFELMDEEKPWGGVKTLEQDLWEYSIVPVPANPNALELAAKSIGSYALIKRWAEEVLDEGKGRRNSGSNNEINIFVAMSEAFSKLTGSPVSINTSVLDKKQASKEADDILICNPDEASSNKKLEAFLGHTADHEEDVETRSANGDDPVVLRIVDEPTFNVDEVAIAAMSSMAVNAIKRSQGQLVDSDFMEGN